MGNCCKPPKKPSLEVDVQAKNNKCCQDWDCSAVCQDKCYSTCCVVIIKRQASIKDSKSVVDTINIQPTIE
jgi:hypothetical protein